MYGGSLSREDDSRVVQVVGRQVSAVYVVCVQATSAQDEEKRSSDVIGHKEKRSFA